MSHITNEDVCAAYVQSARLIEACGEGPVWEHMLPHHLLSEWMLLPLPQCYAALERACDDDLIDYGTSLRSGWLTDKGIALLTAEDKSFYLQYLNRDVIE